MAEAESKGLGIRVTCLFYLSDVFPKNTRLGGTADPSAVRALVMGTLLIYNGSIAFTVTALFMASASYAILATGALPKWTGWVACASAILCLMAIPAIYVDVIDTSDFYNVAGWGPAIVANVPVLIWFFITSITMIRKQETVALK